MNERAVTRGLAAGGLLLATGCDDPLAHVELIDKTRILGAKVEVAGDPTRAAPLPGEDVLVRWLVVAPDPNATFAYRFEACVALDSPSDLASCSGAALAVGESVDPAPGEPTVAFTAPADATGSERIAVLGGVCSAGASLTQDSGLSCSDGSSAQAASLDFAMDDGSHPNTNPALTSVAFDGSELASDTAATTDCALLPTVARGTQHRFAIELDPASRDPVETVSAGDPTRESLLVSYFATTGELDHAFSAIDSTAPSTAASVAWTAPAPRDQPLLARLIVVVRDGRGGSDFAERRVCVTP